MLGELPSAATAMKSRRVVLCVRIDRGRRHVRGGMRQHGVAVGVGARDHAGADGAACAAAVLHDDRLAELLRQRFEHDAGHDVDGAARRERDDGADLLRRPGLRAREARQCGRRERGADQAEMAAAREFEHVKPPR